MKQVKIKWIEEPDFGCEGRMENEKAYVKIGMEDGDGKENICSMEEKEFFASGMDDGMTVLMDENGTLRRKKLGIFFPGWRHSTDRALLYYPEKMCRQKGYETLLLHYDEKRDEKKKAFSGSEAIEKARSYLRDVLADICFKDYSEIFFYSKSMGTVLAGWTEEYFHLKNVTHCFLTPLPETIPYLEGEKKIVIAGAKDTFLNSETLKRICDEKKIPFYLFQDVGHNMEADSIKETLAILGDIMNIVEKVIP